jgi:hypothetical protein
MLSLEQCVKPNAKSYYLVLGIAAEIQGGLGYLQCNVTRG